MPCRFAHHDGNSIKWLELGEQRGFRIVARDPRWKGPSLGLEGQFGAYCETCPNDGQIANATLRLAVSDSSQATRQDLEAAVSPNAVALFLASPPYRIPGATYHANADAVPVSIGDLTGLARRIGIEAPGGSGEVIALQVGKGCVSVFALLTARSAAEIATDGLDVFARAVGMEWFKPDPDPFYSDKFFKSFGLGDNFRPENWGLR
jgi:hypothetical protein